MPRKKKEPRIAVIDFETDPFQFGADIAPFAAGFYDGKEYVDFWGDDCQEKLVSYLNGLKEPLHIYAHNGGKFDFVFLLRGGHIENPMKIINGRIVSAKLGIHTLRDSYAILPVPLKDFAKEKIDYDCFKRHRREKYKNDILHYLAKDCEYLHEFVTEFVKRFGIKLTAASMAYGKLKEYHPQIQTGERFDETFREFYYGGRVECIESGIISDSFSVYDVNSMYPAVMRNFNHPADADHIVASTIRPDKFGFLPGKRAECVYYAEIEADSDKALPIRTKEGIDFPRGRNKFLACSHEIQAGIETGQLKNIIYHKVMFFIKSQRFANFVDTFMAEKIEAKKAGDEMRERFAKLIMNSSYGKAGMNPRNFKDFRICQTRGDVLEARSNGFTLYSDYGDGLEIWQKPAPVTRFNNVAVAASITSAARSVLLRARAKAVHPVYCDTDSLICRELELEKDDSALGAWKLEAQGDRIAIAGKKLYALMAGDNCVKLASKGVRLTHEEIFRLCSGQTVTWRKESPAFGLDGSTRYIEREIKCRL